MIKIQTQASFDDQGAKQLKTKGCHGICASGNATPEVCEYYVIRAGEDKKMQEFCNIPQGCDV